MFGLSAPASLAAAAKAQAQGAAQGAAQQVASSDAAKAVRAGAESVGLGDELSALEERSGITAPSCPKDQIDYPTISNIPVSSADNPIDAQTTMDSFFSYVIIDSKNPTETEQKQKTNAWYISLASAAFFIGLSITYSQLK